MWTKPFYKTKATQLVLWDQRFLGFALEALERASPSLIGQSHRQADIQPGSTQNA